jgi:hypothetical protein
MRISRCICLCEVAGLSEHARSWAPSAFIFSDETDALNRFNFGDMIANSSSPPVIILCSKIMTIALVFTLQSTIPRALHSPFVRQGFSDFSIEKFTRCQNKMDSKRLQRQNYHKRRCEKVDEFISNLAEF